MRKSGDTETLALQRVATFYGDPVFARDDGVALVRLMADGRVQIYPDKPDQRRELVRDADAEPLQPQPCSPRDHASAIQSARDVLTTLAAAELIVDAAVANPDSHWIVCAGLTNLAQAITRVGDTSFGRRALEAGLSDARLVLGDAAKARFSEGILTVTLAPEKGGEGLLSSYAMEDPLMNGL